MTRIYKSTIATCKCQFRVYPFPSLDDMITTTTAPATCFYYPQTPRRSVIITTPIPCNTAQPKKEKEQNKVPSSQDPAYKYTRTCISQSATPMGPSCQLPRQDHCSFHRNPKDAIGNAWHAAAPDHEATPITSVAPAFPLA
jgi:hypothetical protein